MDNFSDNIGRLLEKEIERLILKDTPILVKQDFWYGTGVYQCPVCNKIVTSGNYCRWCGQRISFPKEK